MPRPELAELPRTAWLEIDLDRLVSNLGALRRALPDGVRIEPVVKADAYGHGAVPVARALESAGADGLSVATFDEGAELRRAGIRLPILVLFSLPPERIVEAARLNLAVSAGDVELLARSLATLGEARAQGRGPRRRLEIHLEVETGLGRAGLDVAILPEAVASIRAMGGTRLGGLWTHLGSPDDPERSAAQSSIFERAAEVLIGRGLPVPRRHLAASGAILAARGAAYDAVRPGLAIYGILPDGVTPSVDRAAVAGELRPVLSVHARPIRVALLPAGTSISYGSSFVTSRPSLIATLPLGYGDGWSRALSNRSEALVRGRRVPLVGTVAMDAVMVDVTDVPGSPVDLDDEFVLLGDQGDERITALEVARRRTTISWEVVAAMARRLPRVYYAAAGPVGLRTLTEERLWPVSSFGTVISVTSRSTRS